MNKILKPNNTIKFGKGKKYNRLLMGYKSPDDSGRGVGGQIPEGVRCLSSPCHPDWF
jgi:hypothetical protein